MLQQVDDGAFQIHPAGRFIATLHLSAENIFSFFLSFPIVGRGRGLAKTTSVKSFFRGNRFGSLALIGQPEVEVVDEVPFGKSDKHTFCAFIWSTLSLSGARSEFVTRAARALHI